MIVDSASSNQCQRLTPHPVQADHGDHGEGEPGRRGRGGSSLVWELELAWPRVGPFAEFREHESKLPVHQQAVRNDLLNLIGEDCYRVFYFAHTTYTYDFDRSSSNPTIVDCLPGLPILGRAEEGAAAAVVPGTKDLLDVWLTPIPQPEGTLPPPPSEDLHVGLDVHWHWNRGFVQVSCTNSVFPAEVDLRPVLQMLRNMVEESFDTLVQNELDTWKEERLTGRGDV